MEEKKYLKWYNKVGYGSGDLAANCIYGLVTSFVMIYLTDTVGLNSGVIGVLIAVARVFDGISDVIFGNLMDKTHTKMGKARPWMLWTQIGNCICLVLLFSVPMGIGQTAQYAYFFIVYVLLNRQQHRLRFADLSDHEEHQRASADGVHPFHVLSGNQRGGILCNGRSYDYSRRRRGRMEKRGNHLRYHRFGRKHDLRILCKRAVPGGAV